MTCDVWHVTYGHQVLMLPLRLLVKRTFGRQALASSVAVAAVTMTMMMMMMMMRMDVMVVMQ